jgi:hypothetical protein
MHKLPQLQCCCLLTITRIESARCMEPVPNPICPQPNDHVPSISPSPTSTTKLELHPMTPTAQGCRQPPSFLAGPRTRRHRFVCACVHLLNSSSQQYRRWKQSTKGSAGYRYNTTFLRYRCWRCPRVLFLKSFGKTLGPAGVSPLGQEGHHGIME